MSDDRLESLLREALPPTPDASAERDVWPSLVARLDLKAHLSPLDMALGAAAAIALMIFPEWLLPLFYHL